MQYRFLLSSPFLLFLSFHINCGTPSTPVTTFISPRSQSVNIARDMVGWAGLINQPWNCTYSLWSITPQVSHSFRFERITQCFFGDSTLCNKCKITISGSRASERNCTDLLADYFGLPTDFISNVQFKPSVMNALLNVGYYIALNDLLYGLYFVVHAPIVYARWDLNMNERICNSGSQGYDPGYFNPSGVSRDNLLNQFIEFTSGCKVPNTEDVTFQPLQNARMACTRLTHFSLAEIQCALGYNLILEKRGHLSINARVYIPGGNRPEGFFLFEPIVGNGHHWEAGAGLTAQYNVWCNEETEQAAALFLGLNITHMFKTTQHRSFDLCQKPNSRYMLATRISQPITDMLRGQQDGSFIEPIAQFKNEITSVANLTTLCVNVSAAVQADFAIMLKYTQGVWNYSFGFGVWARSCEQITLRECPEDIAMWALKGDAQLFGFEQNTQAAIPLSATQSKASVHSGANFPSLGNATPQEIAQAKQNPRIDSPLPAFSDSQTNGVFLSDVTEPSGADQINTSIQPRMLSVCDINLASAADRSVTNKLFAHVDRTWCDGRPVEGYVGIGGQIEFGGTTDPTPPAHLEGCFNCALSLWSIWVKGGILF